MTAERASGAQGLPGLDCRRLAFGLLLRPLPSPPPPPLARAARHRVARPPLVVVQFGNGQTLTASCSPARQVGAGAGLEARP